MFVCVLTCKCVTEESKVCLCSKKMGRQAKTTFKIMMTEVYFLNTDLKMVEVKV